MPARSSPSRPPPPQSEAPLRDAAGLIADVAPPATAELTPEAIEAALGRVKLTKRTTTIAREVLIDGLDLETAMTRHAIKRPALRVILDLVTTEARTPPGWRRVELWLPNEVANQVEDLGRHAIGLPPKIRTTRGTWRAADRTIDYDAAALAEQVKAKMRARSLTYRALAATIGLSNSQVWRVKDGDPVADDAVLRVRAWLEKA
ncbi:TrfB-related DNA-binding protein [Belnapia sp. F-4-1]|uniref:TrfB-related DNA-binding protein n=1 Tax=Belnapia sp. F-4-1 TaxID=1545443 RepID=UPI0005BA6DE2|nr:TrfB-related DNA-binding protein [Belnapia sp. F-4-1]